MPLIPLAFLCQSAAAQIPSPREVLQRLRECVEYRVRLSESDAERAKLEEFHRREVEILNREIAVTERERDLEAKRAGLLEEAGAAKDRRIAELESIVERLTARRRSWKCLWFWKCGRPGG